MSEYYNASFDCRLLSTHHKLYKTFITKSVGICFFNISYLFYPPIYAMKLRVKLRNWLWDKVRRPKIELAYHPSEIMKRINETENWEEW